MVFPQVTGLSKEILESGIGIVLMYWSCWTMSIPSVLALFWWTKAADITTCRQFDPVRYRDSSSQTLLVQAWNWITRVDDTTTYEGLIKWESCDIVSNLESILLPLAFLQYMEVVDTTTRESLRRWETGSIFRLSRDYLTGPGIFALYEGRWHHNRRTTVYFELRQQTLVWVEGSPYMPMFGIEGSRFDHHFHGMRKTLIPLLELVRYWPGLVRLSPA
jgi:hypothetical protein